jgi:hypothetical protein
MTRRTRPQLIGVLPKMSVGASIRPSRSATSTPPRDLHEMKGRM